MQAVTELLGETKRKVVYIAYGLIGVAFGATQTGFLTAEMATPLWFAVALAVYTYIGVAFGLVAAQNVGAKDVVVASEPIEYVELQDPDDVYLGQHGVLEDDVVYDTEPEIVDLGVTEIN